jgi:hypothetical protein
MSGVLLLLIFLALGLAIANRVFADQTWYIRIWSGSVIGLIGLMWGVIPFAFIFGFGMISHLLAIVLMGGIYFLVRLFYKEEGELKIKPDGNELLLALVVIPIFLITSYLLFTHVLVPGKDGGIYGGQSTYGDLQFHCAIITNVAQGAFPPDYSLFPGERLDYPFLGDSLSSSLYVFGTSLRWSILLPSFVMILMLVAGFFIFALEILKHKYAAAFASVLFFLNGGFGFIYFMDGLKNNPGNFTRIFTEWYHTPTNYNEHFIRWSNTICDMIIPQRTFMVGWMVVLFAFWLLYRAVTQSDKKYFIYAGIVTGLLPMIHMHSFLSVCISAAMWSITFLFTRELDPEKDYIAKIMQWSYIILLGVMLVSPQFIYHTIIFMAIMTIGFVIYYTKSNPDKSAFWNYIKNWLIFIVPVVVLALPQIFFWTISSQTTGSGFLRTQLGWTANEGDNWIWFWTKNIGIVFVLLVPTIFAVKRRLLAVYSGAIALFIIANIILFQPNDYDNNKIFYVWYMFSVFLVTAYVFSIYQRMKGINARWLLMAILIFFGTFSAVLTIGREANSADIQNYDKNAVAVADYVNKHTPKDALFISGDQHVNPIATFTGRNLYCGTGLFLFFHGVNYQQRAAEISAMYKYPDQFGALAAKIKIDYVYYSNYERDQFKVEPTFFEQNYPTVFHQGDIYVFAISDRAKQWAKNVN